MRVKTLIAALAATLSVVPAAQAASVPDPAVKGPLQGGVKGYPWNASLIGLAGSGYDYTEQEFSYGGTATSKADGVSAPYTSRMLVRVPRDPAKFTGTVLVEWLNVTGQNDLETAWPVEAEYLMRHGIAYVGVSAQLAGVCCGPTTLKAWDPVRYAELLHPGDRFAADIFSQSIQALRSPTGTDPMRGMRPAQVVATGASQSASQLTNFVNQGYNRGGIDLYVITRGGGPYNDFSTPIIMLNEENNKIPQPDNPNFVGWEEAGASHAPAVWWNDYIWPELQRDQNLSLVRDPLELGCSVNRGTTQYSSRAISHWTERFFQTGQMPPSAPRVERDAGGAIVRDADGLAKGGLRHVFVEVPVAFNSSVGCPLWGTYRSWSSAKVRERYPTHAGYVAKVRNWADHEVDLGWLLPEDRDEVIAKAQAFTGPWTAGTCYDQKATGASEKGPVSGTLSTQHNNTSLPLGTGTVLREVSCTVAPLGL